MKRLITNSNPFILLLLPVVFALIMGISYQSQVKRDYTLAGSSAAAHATSLFYKGVTLVKTVCSNCKRKSMVISTEGLSFNFGNQQVVKSLSLQVPEGSIYGFLGPNGAGKTTTIKLLLNLLKTDQGSIHVFDKELQSNRIEILSQIGSLIEQPAIYLHLSGKENLMNRALLLEVSESRVDEMLKLVHLTDAAHKKAGKYSLGMKQRLGIALALLPDPKLLILDELHTNGLRSQRNHRSTLKLLIRLVTQHNKTVFISSHLLAEVERS